MQPLFDFSDENRRIQVDPCVWYKGCSRVGTKWSIILVNDEGPKKIKLCEEHDKENKKYKAMRGEPIADLATIMRLFGMDPDALNLTDEKPPAEVEKPPAPESPALKLEPPKAEQKALPAPSEPEEPEEAPKRAELAQMVDDTRKSLEELRRDFPDVVIPDIAPRPSESHFLCGFIKEDGSLCAEWIDTSNRNRIPAHARKHGVEIYELRLYPTLKVPCKDKDHKLAGCVRSFDTHESLRQHIIHTRLKPLVRVPPQSKPETLPLEDAAPTTT